MRKTERSGGFFLCLLLNIFLNPEGLIIAAVLFALHLWVDIPLWISLLVLGIWLVIIIAQMLFIGWASRCGSEHTPPRQNKNPYSANADTYKKH